MNQTQSKCRHKYSKKLGIRILKSKKFKNTKESGAVLIMALLLTFLLLSVCIGLLTAASMNTKNITDSVAESQAYYAGESGLQSAINVLRGNRCPNPLIVLTEPCLDPVKDGNDISFLKATTPALSNKSNDPYTNPTNPKARLSRWIDYNYTPAGQSFPDRVVVADKADGSAGTYTPDSGMAFSVEVSDPDNSTASVTYATKGEFLPYDTEGDLISGASSITTNSTGTKIIYTSKIATQPGSTTIEFINKPQTTYPMVKDLITGEVTTKDADIGEFKITRGLLGSAPVEDSIRFEIAYSTTKPLATTRYIRGTILSNSSANQPVSIEIDSPQYVIQGSYIKFAPTVQNFSLTQPLLALGETKKKLDAIITPSEPLRILVKSTGYGPRGAKKEFEAILRKNYFSDLGAPSSLTLVSDPSASSITFNPGTSSNVIYSGTDQQNPNVNIPSIGVTSNAALRQIQQTNIKTPADPPAANVSGEVPDWFASPETLDQTIQRLRAVADASGRLFGPGNPPVDYGIQDGKGITFVEGDANLNKDGGGILVVTGTLTLSGNFSFKGLIIVTGPGGLVRNGGGNGTLAGNTVIAPYNPADITPNNTTDPPAKFLTPNYSISGGGNSTLQFNSSSVNNGLSAISNFVIGVSEK